LNEKQKKLKVVVLADKDQQQVFTGKVNHETVDLVCVDAITDLIHANADLYFDLLFSPDPGRIEALKNLGGLVVIHSPVHTLAETSLSFARINGWTGFLNRPLLEIAVSNEERKGMMEEVFSILQWPLAFVPDLPGLVAARVISMIINEAFLAIEDQVSSREEIDIAMRSGTNYPFGPFEWARQIGIKNIYSLLEKMAEQDSRYCPSTRLKQEAENY
jgi:3-hydroxybutyryl-CoA dehydrogenase